MADGFVCSEAHGPTTIGTLDKPGENLSCLVLHGAAAGGDLFLYPVKYLTTYKRVMGVLNAYPLAGRLADGFLALERNIALLVVYTVADIGFIVQNTLDLGDSPGVPLALWLVLEDMGECAVSLEVEPCRGGNLLAHQSSGDPGSAVTVIGHVKNFLNDPAGFLVNQ